MIVQLLGAIHRALLDNDVSHTLDGDHNAGEIIATIKGKDYLITVKELPSLTFADHCDDWFEGLSELSRHPSSLTYQLKQQTQKIATKANTLTARKMVQELYTIPTPLKAKILETFDAVVRQKFSNEFRFTYSTNLQRVSAASCLFSQLHQALTYYDVKKITLGGTP